ncbi:unnamed protein product [Rotaria sordida]|uniref:NEL domain-containing protein n=1 Tax=Rotaria sordida TaxID=392033 RepID=A0A813U276_9BILA|nr:unnamed protein product [Rotaria sordida]
MDFHIIRGTSLTLHQRQNQAISRLTHSYSMPPLQRSSTELERGEQAGTVGMLSAQTQSSKLSRPTPMTWPELTESLEAWEDPEDGVQDVEAKKRIKNCFRQRSDRLDLSFLSLSTLPDVIGRMQHVQFLSIANNYFSEIPQALANLANLRLLNVSNNVLKEVPDSIKEFKKLELFNAACNQLRKVSAELARLPKIETVMLAHNRILKFPENIHNIKDLDLEDQVPLASFSDFSIEFAARWEEDFQYEAGSGYLEIWVARYEEILRLPEAAKYREIFKERIGILLDTMMKNPGLRARCYYHAQNVIATCHDGILFSLFEMEIKQVEERMIALQLSDEEVRQEMERAFNFYRLQELALLHSEQHSYKQAATTEEVKVDTLETVLFFYTSPANTLDMPLGGERLRFMRYPTLSQATHDDQQRRSSVQILNHALWLFSMCYTSIKYRFVS